MPRVHACRRWGRNREVQEFGNLDLVVLELVLALGLRVPLPQTVTRQVSTVRARRHLDCRPLQRAAAQRRDRVRAHMDVLAACLRGRVPEVRVRTRALVEPGGPEEHVAERVVDRADGRVEGRVITVETARGQEDQLTGKQPEQDPIHAEHEEQ